MLTALLVVLHVFFSLVLVLFILMHRGTGGGLSDLFGGGLGGLQGSVVVERNLDRLTVVSAIGFLITDMLLVARL